MTSATRKNRPGKKPQGFKRRKRKGFQGDKGPLKPAERPQTRKLKYVSEYCRVDRKLLTIPHKQGDCSMSSGAFGE